MTGEQLYEGWRKAAHLLGYITMPWTGVLQSRWKGVSEIISALGPPSAYQLLVALGSHGSSWEKNVADELCGHWQVYFGGFDFSGHAAVTDSEHAKGDIWVFRAGKSRAKVIDVDGRMVKLRLNGIDTDWINVDELMKDAIKEVK